MAPSSLTLCFPILLTLLSFPPPTTSQHLLLPLHHSLSTTTTTTTHHLLKSTTTSSTARHHNHHKQISLPLSPGTDYTLTFTLNSQTISVYMDTGSDLVWFPCSPFTCILCDTPTPMGPTTPPLNITKSSLVTCKSRACSAIHPSLSSSDLCAAASCPLEEIEISDCSNFACPNFYYAYGDGSLIAQLHMSDLTLPSNSKRPLILKNFTFGCSHSALNEPVGVAGFGFGQLSLPAQLGRHVSPDLGAQFSYCLVSHSFDSVKLKHPSPLILGKYNNKGIFGISRLGFVYTPMLDNPKRPYFYSVGLESIRVGPVRIRAPGNLKRVDGSGNGGVVVDSGTTYTMLPSKFYNLVVAELDRVLGRVLTRAGRAELSTGLSPCYYVEEGVSLDRVVPSLVLEFVGNASVVLPRRNYFYEFTMDGGDEMIKGRRVGCLMMMDFGDEEESGPGATLGNYQQQGFEVVYDLEMKRVGFARRKCASMWANLNRS